MNYERRFKNQDNRPIKENQYSYYITDIKNSNENYSGNNIPKLNTNSSNLISTQMRMSNIESRLTTMEKMMKYFDEFIHLKEEEKMNNLNSLELSSNIPVNELILKINNLEKKLDLMQKQKQQSDIENEKIIKNLNDKIEFLEKLINTNNLSQNLINKNIPQENNINNNNEEDNFTLNANNDNKILDKKNLEIEEIIKNKLDEIYSNNKIKEILKLIEDINKVAEDNEFNINEQNENIRKIQNDNLTLIKVVAIHSEKINSIDYILNELTNLKNKYFKIVNSSDNIHDENGEEMSQNEMNQRFIENSNQNEINNIENDNQNNNDKNNND
jgi:hypothetical protein